MHACTPRRTLRAQPFSGTRAMAMDPRDPSWLHLSHIAAVLDQVARYYPRVYQNWTRILRIVLNRKPPTRRGGMMKKNWRRSPHAAWKSWVCFAARPLVLRAMAFQCQFGAQNHLEDCEFLTNKNDGQGEAFLTDHLR